MIILHSSQAPILPTSRETTQKVDPKLGVTESKLTNSYDYKHDMEEIGVDTTSLIKRYELNDRFFWGEPEHQQNNIYPGLDVFRKIFKLSQLSHSTENIDTIEQAIALLIFIGFYPQAAREQLEDVFEAEDMTPSELIDSIGRRVFYQPYE